MTNEITDEEFDILINEVAERFKDTIYIDGEKIARGLLEQIRDNIIDYPMDEPIKFNVILEMTAIDLRQIIGRQRR